MAVDDTLLRHNIRRRTPAEIAAERSQSGPAPAGLDGGNPADVPEQEPAKKSDPIPQPDDAYRASARFMERLQTEQKFLHFMLKDGTLEGFAYSDLRKIRWVPGTDPAASPVLKLRFVEAGITDVEIKGRHLRDIHHYISLGVLPWVREYPGNDFEDETTPVITRITIQPAKG